MKEGYEKADLKHIIELSGKSKLHNVRRVRMLLEYFFDVLIHKEADAYLWSRIVETVATLNL